MVSQDILKLAADRFQFDAASAVFISNSCNEVYKFTRQDQSYILRLSEKPAEYADNIKAEMEWVHYLAQHGVSVSLPVLSQDQQMLEIYQENEKCYIATAFQMAPGRIIHKTDPLWGRELFQKWGEVMGKMHHVTQSYNVKPSTTGREEWSVWDIDTPHLRQGDFELIYNKFKTLERTISTYPKNRESYGLIHNDFHPYNFHMDGDQLIVFDFDDAMYGWFALDIAIAAVHATWLAAEGMDRQAQNEFAKQFLGDFLEGYSKHHHLADEAVKQIPTFMDYRNISSFFWRMSSWNGDESTLTKDQADAIARAAKVAKSNVPFDGCDIQI